MIDPTKSSLSNPCEHLIHTYNVLFNNKENITWLCCFFCIPSQKKIIAIVICTCLNAHIPKTKKQQRLQGQCYHWRVELTRLLTSFSFTVKHDESIIASWHCSLKMKNKSICLKLVDVVVVSVRILQFLLKWPYWSNALIVSGIFFCADY